LPDAIGVTRLLLVVLLALAGLPDRPAAARPAGDPVLVAVGDISPDPFRPWLGGQDDLATADLAESLAPDLVLPLGDNQYEFGKTEAFTHPEGYARSWGRQGIYERSCPVAGNHEYWTTPGAAGFQGYFTARLRACAQTGRPDLGWYAYDLGTWRVYALNTDCGRTSPYTSPPCDAASEQVRWLQRDLQANAGRRCILAYWHHQRWGSYFPDDRNLRYLWNALNHVHADLVLAGHEHSYARFTAMTWDGHVAPLGRGIRQIVVGTGGRSLLAFTDPPREGVRHRDDQHFGVLKLTLRDGGWSSEFHRVGGVVDDRVAAGCWT
jgi:acid phosphatase type 7